MYEIVLEAYFSRAMCTMLMIIIISFRICNTQNAMKIGNHTVADNLPDNNIIMYLYIEHVKLQFTN